MTEPPKLVEKAMKGLNATWNSVKQRAMAWCLSRSCGGLLYVHYARVTARDSIGHVKKCFFGNVGSNVQGGSVGRASVFHARDVGSNLALVIFFSHFFFFFLIANSLDS